MGAAAHIGRVGGLAVALGVGTAIATGHGVALADDGDSGTSTSSAESSSPQSATEKSESDETPSQTGSTTATTTDDESTEEAPAGTTGVVTAQTNTGTSPTAETSEDSGAEDEAVEEEEQAVTSETPDPEPAEPEEPAEPPSDDDPPTAPSPSSSSTKSRSAASTTATTAAQEVATTSARTAQSLDDPASPVRRTETVARFVDARVLAAASPVMMSPKMAALSAATEVTEVAPASTSTPPRDLFAAVTTLVSNVVNWVLNPMAGTAPTGPTQPVLMWGLLAFARREFESFLTGLSGQGAAESTAAQTTTSLALAAAAAAANPRPGFPRPGQQLSPSTKFIDWVTGNYPTNNTAERFGVWGTDIGVMWDNGMEDDPSTPWNEHQVLIAVGDTFSGPNMSGIWRLNTIFRSADDYLADGMSIPDGEWFNGNMFGGAPLSSPTFARQIIHPAPGLPTGVTLIPTAGIALPTPGTQFGVTQYVSFMSVSQWGSPGRWTTNYSAIAYSTDNGENWTVAPSSVRYNSPWSGHRNFQQSAFVRGEDGYVYVYGTPNGRQGAAYVARVLEKDILDVSQYEYYNGGTRAWIWSTPAGWYKNDPGKATPVFGVDRGACGVGKVGNQVSEMSVQYNKHLDKYVVLHGDQFNNIVMRTADNPEGPWSSAKVLMGQQNGGIYAPMMHPWSPSTLGTGSELYWNLSLWSEYNVMLMSTDLDKV